MTTPQTAPQTDAQDMTDTKLAPDELAKHLSEVAKQHGAALTDFTFLTHTAGVTGQHSYTTITSQQMDQPLPDTILVAGD
tara:strand:+ start:261 stop:500 length:240 start_codon:yes stop_codon:yes gene_type:complete